MRRLLYYPAPGRPNSLAYWWQVRNPLRTIFNFGVIQLSKYCPSLMLKNVLLRLTGMRIGGGARISPDVTFDYFFPELIEIGDGAVIGFQSLIVTHEFLVDEYRTGKTLIGARALVGARSTVLAGVSVGAGAQVGAMSLVNADVPSGALVGGVPAKIIKHKKR